MDSVAEWNPVDILNQAAAYRDDLWGLDHLSLFTMAVQGIHNDSEPLRFGGGETVPTSYLQLRTRMLFLQSLYQRVPDTTADLVTDEAYALACDYKAKMKEWGDYVVTLNVRGDLTQDVAEAFLEDAGGPMADHTLAWQNRYQLTDDWLSGAAYFTVIAAMSFRTMTGKIYDGPLCVRRVTGTVHDGRKHPEPQTFARRFLYTPDHMMIDVPVYLDNLKHPDGEGDWFGWEDDGEIGSFDPRTETVEAATNRLLATLRPRMRAALEHIAASDRVLTGAVVPVILKTMRPYEWLVQYQVRGESMRAIHRADGVDLAHVSRTIRATADLVGITLRKPTRGGRPRKVLT